MIRFITLSIINIIAFRAIIPVFIESMIPEEIYIRNLLVFLVSNKNISCYISSDSPISLDYSLFSSAGS